MISGIISTKIKVYKANTLVNDLLALAKKLVLVGVPEETSSRWVKVKEGKKTVKKPSPVSNAMLAYIHDRGSPLQNIPPRPFMQPGIKNVQDKINKELMAVAKAQIEKDKEKVNLHLNRAGLIAQNSIKNVITEGIGFEPLKRGTKLGRLRRKKSARKWDEAKREAAMSSFHPLVATGQLRNAISYVVVDK